MGRYKLICKIFYDGVNIAKYINQVVGVTTNTSYIAEAGITDYNKFIDESLEIVGGKSISFQVTERTLDGIEKQARFLSGKGDNVYVKIPILLPDETSTTSLIKKLFHKIKLIKSYSQSFISFFTLSLYFSIISSAYHLCIEPKSLILILFIISLSEIIFLAPSRQ